MQSAASHPPSAHVVPFRLKPRITDTQVIEGHLITDDCPVCGRTDVQHGKYACTALDLIAARVAYGKLPWYRRLVTRTPAGW